MSALKLRVAGLLKTAQTFYVVNGGVLRRAKTKKVMQGGFLRVVNFTAPLTVAISPASFDKIGSTSTLSTSTHTATPTGGLAPYTYAWTVVSFDGSPSPTISAPTSAATVFTQTNLALEQIVTATFRVTVTDSLGTTAQSNVTGTFNRTNFS